MGYRAQIDDRGVVTRYKDTDTGEVISAREMERRTMAQHGQYVMSTPPGMPQMTAASADPYHSGNPYAAGQAPAYGGGGAYPAQPVPGGYPAPAPGAVPGGMPAQGGYPSAPMAAGGYQGAPQGMSQGMPQGAPPAAAPPESGNNPLIQPGAQVIGANGAAAETAAPGAAPAGVAGAPAGDGAQQKNLRMEGVTGHKPTSSIGYKTHGFLDATSIAILLPTLVLLALIIAAAHKKRLFPWQTIRTFNPPSGLMGPRDYERSFVCPPNLRRHGRMGKRNPEAAWSEQDGIVIPFGFLARTHLPVTIPLGRLPNKNMFIVAPSGSGKTTLMRAIMKALLAKPCVMIALEAKANDPNLDEKKESFKHTVLPEAKAAGFDALYFNPLDQDSVTWNPLDVEATAFASSIVQDVNSLPPEEQHWAERDHGYICGLVKLLKWGAVQVVGEDENGQTSEVRELPCNPRGLMRLVNNRRNIVESLRRLKNSQVVEAGELNELTMTLSSIIRTDTDWDKNIQGVRGRLRMFRNEFVLRTTDASNIDLKVSMHKPTVLIFGAPASLGPDAESLAACFVYQLQQALHTRYGTASVLPLFAFFDEYQTLNIDLAGRLSAIVRGANGGLAVILQNISQIAKSTGGKDPTSGGASELKTLFSNCAIRVCLHNADDSTARFFSDEIGKHAVIMPGISDHYESNGFGIFPTSWNRIHSQQVVSRVDADSIKRMEKQHALVYLSPAGDPQFGETKPFMVDLRGIEEIARLHLLHNVAGRSPSPEGEATPETPVPPAGAVPSMPAGMAGLVRGVAQGVANAAANVVGNNAGNNQGAQQQQPEATLTTSAVILPVPVPQPLPTGVPGGAAIPAPITAPIAGSASGVTRPASSARPFPGGPVPSTVNAPAPPTVAQSPLVSPRPTRPAPEPAAAPVEQPVAQPPQPQMQRPMQQPVQTQQIQAPAPQPLQAQAPQPVQAQAPQQAQAPAPQAVQAPAAQPAQAPAVNQPVQAAPPQPVQAPTAQQAQAPAPQRADLKPCPHCNKPAGKGRFCIECGKFLGAAGPAQAPAPATDRPAVTSLHADMSKFGLPNPASHGQGKAKPRAGTGVEF
ncbi:MAG: type IV secretory system conjugative DNA transfer family protein [Candidatus Obscuribacterales bacterium]|nr:type IV secretory system conjugative DNA transfer family protein [Candidatus Obscuribacterales bacterium]